MGSPEREKLARIKASNSSIWDKPNIAVTGGQGVRDFCCLHLLFAYNPSMGEMRRATSREDALLHLECDVMRRNR